MTATQRTMRIIVTGTRTWREVGTVQKAIAAAVRQHFFGYEEVSKEELESVFGSVTVAHGGAKGADTIAGEFAQSNGMKVEVFSADWDAYGNKAGPIRNQEMVRSDPKADVCLAFLADSNSPGTRSTIRFAEKRGIPVMEIPPLVA